MIKYIYILITLFILSGCILTNKTNDNKVTNNIKVDNIDELYIFSGDINNIPSKYKNNNTMIALLYLNYGNYSFREKFYSDKAINLVLSSSGYENNTLSLYTLGYAYEIKKEYKKALNYYNKALTKVKDERYKALILNQIGHIYDLEGNINKAGELYKTAYNIYKSPIIVNNYARYLIRIKKNNEAIKLYKEIIGIKANTYFKAELYYNLALAYKNIKDKDNMILYANKGLEIEPKYFNNYILLGSYHILASNNKEKGLNLIKKAINIYPVSAIAYKYLGVYYFIKDDYDKAISAFNKQVLNANKDITIMGNDKTKIISNGYFSLGKVYALKGDIDNSINYLEKATKLDDKYKIQIIYELYNLDTFNKIKNNVEFKNYISKIFKK